MSTPPSGGKEKYLKEIKRIPKIAQKIEEIDNAIPIPDQSELWKIIKEEKIVHNCPIGMPQKYALPGNIYDRKKIEKIDPKIRYRKAAAELAEGKPTKKTILEAAQKHIARQPTIRWQDDQGADYYFRGRVRGDKRYARDIRERVLDASRQLTAIPGTTLFCTLTYRADVTHRNIIRAQNEHKLMVDKWLRAMRNRADLEYITTIEQTEQGFPHTHVLMRWRDEYHEYRKDRKGRLLLRDRNLYKWMKARQDMQQFKVFVVPKDKTTNYLIKYIAKGIDECAIINQIRPDELTDEQYKCLLGNMVGVITQHRQLRISKGLHKPKQQLVLPPPDLETELAPAVEKYLKEEEEQEAVLKGLMNKLTTQCKCTTQIIANNTINSKIEHLLGYYPKGCEELEGIFARYGSWVGCPGCIVTEWLDELAGCPPKKAWDLDPEQVLPLAPWEKWEREGEKIAWELIAKEGETG